MHYRAAMMDSRRRPPRPAAAVGTAAVLLSLLILRRQMAKIFTNFANSAIIALMGDNSFWLIGDYNPVKIRNLCYYLPPPVWHLGACNPRMHIEFHQPRIKDDEVIGKIRNSRYYRPYPFLLNRRL
jgi:hypothetical protein